MKVFKWVTDTGYSIWAKFLGLVNKKVPARYSISEPAHTATLVLIPGISERWGGLKPIADFLNSKGYTIWVVPELGYNMRDIPTSAKIVVNAISKQKIKNVILLSHSKGSLIGKYILANYNEQNNIKGMVALAGVFGGTPWAKLNPFKAFMELHPTSKIINELKNNTEVNKKIVSIYPQWDQYLSATKSSYLERASNNIKVNVKGHVKIIYDETAWEEVAKAIRKIETL